MNHVAQLTDGRWVRIRELTSQMQAKAYESASSIAPNGSLIPPNPITLDTECLKLAVIGVTKPLSVWRLDADGKRVPLVRDGKPVTKADGSAVFERYRFEDVPAEAWRELAYGELNTEFDKLFGPKDRAIIAVLYGRAHNPQEDERDFFSTIRSVSESA